MVNPIKAGVTFGTLLGVWLFAGRSGLLLVGPTSDRLCVLDAFIRPVYVIKPFSLPIAAVLIVVTSVIGFAIASLFGLLWNKLHRYQGLE
jgi:hypothetical protein